MDGNGFDSTASRRPSYEGRGLKFLGLVVFGLMVMSPLTRGAWIEIALGSSEPLSWEVAPHTRGAD